MTETNNIPENAESHLVEFGCANWRNNAVQILITFLGVFAAIEVSKVI